MFTLKYFDDVFEDTSKKIEIMDTINYLTPLPCVKLIQDEKKQDCYE